MPSTNVRSQSGDRPPGDTPRPAGPDYVDYRRRGRILLSNRALVWGVIAAAFAWAVWGTGFGLITLIDGFATSAAFIVTDLLPPRLDVAPQYVDAALETLYMSYVGMAVSIVLSIPLGVLAARNITVHRVVAYFAKATTGFIRAVPEIVFAMFLVGVFGLGPLAGTIALGVGGVGILAKNYADSFEKIDMEQLEGLRATGATWLQILGQGVWPQFKPSFISWSLFRLDLNIRSAAVLGLVGAGGLGHSLNQAISLYQFRSATTIILMIFVMILAVEAVTGTLRKRLL